MYAALSVILTIFFPVLQLNRNVPTDCDVQSSTKDAPRRPRLPPDLGRVRVQEAGEGDFSQLTDPQTVPTLV